MIYQAIAAFWIRRAITKKIERIQLKIPNCYLANRISLAIAVAIASRGTPIGLMQSNYIRAVGDVGQSTGLGH